MVAPTTDQDVRPAEAQLALARRSTGGTPVVDARKYADGIVSWLSPRGRRPRRPGRCSTARPARSATSSCSPSDQARRSCSATRPAPCALVGPFGVLPLGRAGLAPRAARGQLDRRGERVPEHGDREVLQTLLEFAVHDLGARGIGATLVYRPDDESATTATTIASPRRRCSQISRPFDLAPLRHALAQIDGATLFDEQGRLRRIGVRLVPSAAAEADDRRHRRRTPHVGARYSFDDPDSDRHRGQRGRSGHRGARRRGVGRLAHRGRRPRLTRSGGPSVGGHLSRGQAPSPSSTSMARSSSASVTSASTQRATPCASPTASPLTGSSTKPIE